jgi:hypothetical protein
MGTACDIVECSDSVQRERVVSNVTPNPWPADLSEERSALGACLLGAAAEAVRLLETEDFSVTAHREIFGVIRASAETGETQLETGLVAAKLRARGALDSVGGEPFLQDLTLGVMSKRSMESRARILRELADRRRLLKTSEELERRATDWTQPPSETLTWLRDDAVTGSRPRCGIRRFDDIPDLMTMNVEPIEYLVDDMIARGTITLWTGTDGTAKTFLVQEMAIAVAKGSPFLGRHCQRCPVLYLDYENPSFAVKERLELMAKGPVDGLKVWGTWVDQQPPQIGDEILLTIARETKPLIIVDPFRYAHTAEENDSTEMMAVMRHLRSYAAAGGAVVVLHHPAKAEGSTGRGSSAIRGAVDVAFQQDLSDESRQITLRCVKNRFGERMIVTIRPDFEEGTFEVTDSPEFRQRAADLDKLQKIIEEAPGQSQNAIYKASGMKKTRLIEMLKAGKDSLWDEQKDGQSFRYFPLVSRKGNNLGNKGTGQGSGGCSPVPIPLDGNRGQASLLTQQVVLAVGEQGSRISASRILEAEF